MREISKLEHLAEEVKSRNKKWRVAIVQGEDINTIQAVSKAIDEGFVFPVFIGNIDAITNLLSDCAVHDSGNYEIIKCNNACDAAELGVKLVKTGQVDMIMKGLINTDLFLKAVLNKENGIMKPNGVLSYVCALELPAYHKLLFITDPAVLPFPNLDQKISMANYAIEMTHKLGNKEPKIALIGVSEKVSSHFPNTQDYEKMCALATSGGFDKCIMDGPLDVFLACDPESVKIKGVKTSIEGDADILLFPTLEASNPFYKGLMLFGGGELAGLIQGTTHPVIVMSRSESLKSKYYCLALACLMAES